MTYLFENKFEWKRHTFKHRNFALTFSDFYLNVSIYLLKWNK